MDVNERRKEMVNERTMLYVCPNGCHASFVAEVRVTAEWKVGCLGEFLEELSSDRGASDYLTMKCRQCRADAEEIPCTEVPVYANDLFKPKKEKLLGSAFIPVNNPENCVYWVANGSATSEYLPIHEKDGTQFLMIHGRRFLMEDGEIFQERECSGQLTLDGQEVA